LVKDEMLFFFASVIIIASFFPTFIMESMFHLSTRMSRSKSALYLQLPPHHSSRRRRWWVLGMFMSSRYLATVRRVN
jgi:hypothetical protein